MKYSKKDREWFKSLEEKGIKSKRMAPAPEMYEDVVWLWDAYNILSSARQFSSNGLPESTTISEILAFCQLRRISNEDDIELLLQTVITLDDVLIEDAFAKRKIEDSKRNRGK